MWVEKVWEVTTAKHAPFREGKMCGLALQPIGKRRGFATPACDLSVVGFDLFRRQWLPPVRRSRGLGT